MRVQTRMRRMSAKWRCNVLVVFQPPLGSRIIYWIPYVRHLRRGWVSTRKRSGELVSRCRTGQCIEPHAAAHAS